MRITLCVTTLLALGTVPAWADDAQQNKTGDIRAPYVEHGQLKNTAPEPAKRDPSPIEKAAQKVIDSPVRPAVVNGQPGVEYHKTTP